MMRKRPTADDLMTILDQVEALEAKIAQFRATHVDRADLEAVIAELNAAGDRYMQRRLAEVEGDLASMTSEADRYAILTIAAGKAVADFDAFVAGIDLAGLTLAAKAGRKAH